MYIFCLEHTDESNSESDNDDATAHVPRDVNTTTTTTSQTLTAGDCRQVPLTLEHAPTATTTTRDVSDAPDWLRRHSRMERALQSPGLVRHASVTSLLASEDAAAHGECGTILDMMLRKQSSISSKIERLALMRSQHLNKHRRKISSTDDVIASTTSAIEHAPPVDRDDVTAVTHRSKKISLANSLYSLPEHAAVTSQPDVDELDEEEARDWSTSRSLNAMGVNTVLKVVRRESSVCHSLFGQ